MNKLEEFIETQKYPDSELLQRIRKTFHEGNIGYFFATEMLKEYYKETEE